MDLLNITREEFKSELLNQNLNQLLKTVEELKRFDLFQEVLKYKTNAALGRRM